MAYFEGINNGCERCSNSEPKAITCSYFNTQMICMKCKEKEKKHERYDEAKAVESEEVRNGNYNFEGIGLPNDLK
jgi:hypothetical protein